MDELCSALAGLALGEAALDDGQTSGVVDERIGLDRGHRNRDLADAWCGHRARSVSAPSPALRVTWRPEPGRWSMTVDLSPGRPFPDIELDDHAGNRRRLSELVGGDPVVLQFFRGWWCPKEQAFFRRLIALQDEAEVAYSRIVSVSVDPPAVSAAFRAGLYARWTFLSDSARTAQAELGLRETTDTLNDPYVPAVFTLFPDLIIHRAYDGYWFWGRPTTEELRLDMREISAAIRTDWTVPAA